MLKRNDLWVWHELCTGKIFRPTFASFFPGALLNNRSSNSNVTMRRAPLLLRTIAPLKTVAVVAGCLVGGILGFMAASIEVRHRAGKKARDKERMMDAFFAASPAGLAILDNELRYERINLTLASMNHLPPEMHLRRTIDDVHGKTGSLIRPVLEQVLSTAQPALHVEFSGEQAGRPGSLRHWVASYFPIVDTDGTVDRIGAVVLDITRRKEMEQALRQSETNLRSLSNRLLMLQDQERRRIARELHDSVGQCMAAIRMNLEVAKKNLVDPPPPEKVTKSLAEAIRLAEQCSNEVRTISYLLHPPLLDDSGLSSAIQWLADGFAERSGIAVEVDVPPSFDRLSPEVETTLFRIVQESLTNIHKHSGSPTARIQLASDAESVFLEIRDEGRGLSSDALHRMNGTSKALGVGIAGMRERLREMRGSLELISDRGTTVRAVIPIGGETWQN